MHVNFPFRSAARYFASSQDIASEEASSNIPTSAFLKECDELLEEFSETIDKTLNDNFKDDYECGYHVGKYSLVILISTGWNIYDRAGTKVWNLRFK